LIHTVKPSILDEGHSMMSPSQTAPVIRILVVDDHSVVRDGLSFTIEREDGMKVVGCAATGEEAVVAAQRLRPDVIVMDLVLPSLNGIDATRQILRELPHTHIIALSACHTPEHVYRALRAGAHGYVLKTAASSELILAINTVTAGDQFVTPAITALFVEGVLRTSIPKSPFDLLSAREREVLRGIVAGSTSADIALDLSLSRKTIDTYRGRIMTKLGVANRSGLIRFALDFELPSM
jgi:two-component system response regulator NreC